MFHLIYSKLRLSVWILLVVFFTGISGNLVSLYGQGNLIDYQNSAKSLFYNPAFTFSGGQYGVSVIPLSSTDFELSLPVSMNDIFEKRKDNSNFILNLPRLSERVGKVNPISFNSTIAYFNISVKRKSGNWGLQVYENIYSALSFEKKLVEFLDKGNVAYINQNFSTQIPFSLCQFSTWQLSWSKKVKQNLRIGLSAKLYFGKSTVNSTTGFSIFTDSLINFVDIGISGNIKASAPVTRSIDDMGHVNNIQLMPDASFLNYIFEIRNPGLGFDFGCQYQYSNQIDFSASIIDLGFISWLNNINSVDIGGSYRWDGLDLTRLIKVPTDTVFMNSLEKMNLADSILYSAMTPSDERFVTMAPLKVYLSANYRYNNQWSFSVINKLSLFNTFLSESFLLSGTYSFKKNWKIYSGLCLSNRSYLNIPLGFSFINNKFQISLSTSNCWGLIIPSYSKTFGVSLSAGLILDGYSKSEKKEMERYPFYQIYKRWLHTE